MARRQRRWLVCLAVTACLPGVVSADSLLSDIFGVTLQLDTANGQPDPRQGNATSYPFLTSSFTPKEPTTQSYKVNDWYGSWSNTVLEDYATWTVHKVPIGQPNTVPSGEEPYDVEAMYFADDPDNLYLAVVTSFPQHGLNEWRYDDIFVGGGDLALDLGLNAEHDPGTSPPHDGWSYDYGVNLTHEVRPASGQNTLHPSDTSIGTDFYRTTNDDWFLGMPVNAIDDENCYTAFDPNWSSFGGQFVGNVTTAYSLYTFPGGLQEGLYPTYIIEATIPRALLGANDPQPGDTIGMSWVMGCRNDGDQTLRLVTTVHSPEPTSLALLAAGLGAAGWLRRRRGARHPRA